MVGGGSTLVQLTALPGLLKPYVARHSKLQDYGWWFPLKLAMAMHSHMRIRSRTLGTQ